MGETEPRARNSNCSVRAKASAAAPVEPGARRTRSIGFYQRQLRPHSFDRCWDVRNNLVECQARFEVRRRIVSEPRAVATGSRRQQESIDPVATAPGSDTT